MKTELESSAKQYAQALIELVSIEGQAGELNERQDALLNDLSSVNATVAQNAELSLVLEHPAVSSQQKKDILISLFGKSVNDLTMRLLELLNDKASLQLLAYIEREYGALLKECRQIITAELIASQPLTEQALADIKARLTEHLGKKLELDSSVDKSLIGGFLLKIGDQVIDGSLKGKLNSIEKTLLSV